MNTKMELLNKLRSHDNKIALQAVEALRARGWLEDGSLQGVALCQAQLQGADLMKANLSIVDFHQAQMDWADLSLANLTAAKLTRASLAGANLEQANLKGADLYKTNLRYARGLNDTQFQQVKRLWGAIMPDGNPYDGRYNLSADIELARWGHVEVSDPEAMAAFYGVSVETYLAGQGEKALAAA
ncbi:MAG TPA: hypothetical protein DEH25_08120 [Chloroflexi bacterium]|nr:hypothetical protein [Chloroflexota bacterium]HBY06965.1 hypothetical protein [Chloroflexota bacterium]